MGPINNFYTSGYDRYEVINGHVFYENIYDNKVYKEGIVEPLNLGEKSYSISRTGNYVVLKFLSTIPNSYKTIIYNKQGEAI